MPDQSPRAPSNHPRSSRISGFHKMSTADRLAAVEAFAGLDDDATANAGAETINCVQQAQEFGLTGSVKLAALLMYVTDVHALGLAAAQGLSLTETFYWT